MKLTRIPQLAVIVSALVLLVLLLPRFAPENLPFTEDVGMSFAVASASAGGDWPLLGPPSHQGGRHLGPFYYYTLGLPFLISGGSIIGTIAFETVLKLVGVLVIGFLCLRIIPGPLRWWGPAAIAIFLLNVRNRELLADPWHPHVLLFSGALFIWGLRKILEHGGRGVGPFLFAASLLVQSHFSAIPLVAGSCLVLGARFLSARASGEKWLSPVPLSFWGWLLATLLVWVPPFLYELNYGSNLSALFLSQAGSHRGAAAGVSAAVHTIALFLQQTFLFGNAGIPTRPQWEVIIPLFTIGAAILCACFRSLSRHDRWLVAAIIVGIGVYVPALARIHGTLYQYFLLPLWAPVLVLAAVTMALSLQTVLGRGALIALLVLGILSVTQRFDPVFPFHTLLHATEVTRLAKADAGERGFRIEVNGPSKFMHGPFAFLSGPSHFHRIRGWDSLKEMPQHERGRKNARRVYGVMCPKRSRLERRWFDERFRIGWVKEGELDDPQCVTCGQCYLPIFQKLPPRMRMRVTAE